MKLLPLPEILPEWVDRFWARVDKGTDDECWIWTGSANNHGYGTVTVFGRCYVAHRLAYLIATGRDPGASEIDHRCFTPGCVNPAHLRLATRKQNVEHRQGANRNSKTGVRGVSPRDDGKFRAIVTHNRQIIRLGDFRTVAEAAEVVRAKRAELYTHNAPDKALTVAG